jgi:hypothetical protein
LRLRRTRFRSGSARGEFARDQAELELATLLGAVRQTHAEMGRTLLVDCTLGIVRLDVDEEMVELDGSAADLAQDDPEVSLPLLLSADRQGARVVAILDRKPPLVVSDDAGITWREAGGGLPPGVAVAIWPEHPDVVAYATESRVYLSEGGGVFWRSLAPELPGIIRVAWTTSSEGVSDARFR